MKIIDISKGLLTTKGYPGDPKPTLTKVLDKTKGDAINLSVISACVHTGTHADAPSHFLDSDISVDKIGLEHFVGRCKVFTCSGLCDDEFVSDCVMDGCKLLLIKGNSHFSHNAKDALLGKGIITVGTECMSVGQMGCEALVHEALLSSNIAILENLDLSKVPDGEYLLAAQPILIEGSDGAFVRAILIK